jgi:hypothetical protein
VFTVKTLTGYLTVPKLDLLSRVRAGALRKIRGTWPAHPQEKPVNSPLPLQSFALAVYLPRLITKGISGTACETNLVVTCNPLVIVPSCMFCPQLNKPPVLQSSGFSWRRPQ